MADPVIRDREGKPVDVTVDAEGQRRAERCRDLLEQIRTSAELLKELLIYRVDLRSDADLGGPNKNLALPEKQEIPGVQHLKELELRARLASLQAVCKTAAESLAAALDQFHQDEHLGTLDHRIHVIHGFLRGVSGQ